MIYSRWRPDTGGYDYFQASERRALGDDLPVPRYGFSSSAIGTSSVSIGRVPSGMLKRSGSGEQALGMVMPVSRHGLSGVPVMDRLGFAAFTTLSFIAGVLIGGYLTRRR